MSDIIKKWKKAKISYGEFTYDCGGDSMNDTYLVFYDKKGNELDVDSELSSYFDDDIYNHVEFYEASDGHYLGESGTVRITLNDEEDDFEYEKDGMAHYSEHVTDTITCTITREQADFIREYISGLSDSNWNGRQTDFKKDFILTDEHEKLIDELHNSLQSQSWDWSPDADGEIEDDSSGYSTENENGGNDIIIEEVDDDEFTIQLTVSCNMYQSQPSDW